MAFRSQSWLKSMVGRLRVGGSGGGSSSTFATSISPKFKAAYPPTATEYSAHHFHPDITPRPVEGEFVPVYVALGMIMLSTGLGLYTAIQHLSWAPGVYVKKSRRERLPEVEEPDHVLDEADRFIKKSFFRKVAHVQDSSHGEDHVMSDPIRGDVLARMQLVVSDTHL